MGMDQEGVLSALQGASGNWSPVLDTAVVNGSNSKKHYWPITICGARLVCVPLAPHESHPNPTRRPTASSLPLKIPLANRGASRATALKLEEVYLRSDLALRQKRLVHADDQDDVAADYERYRTNVDKVTLKLYFEAVRANQTEMALDLVGRLHKEKSYDVALKAADRMNRVQLSEEIEKKRDDKFGVMEEEEDYFEEEDGYYSDEQPHRRTTSTTNDTPNSSTHSSSQLRNISPEAPKRLRLEEEENNNNHAPPSPSAPEPKRRKKKNPFGKKSCKSPSAVLSPPKPRPQLGHKDIDNDEPPPMKLSRMSAFATKARHEAKKQKEYSVINTCVRAKVTSLCDLYG